jgi:hypothetical protein
VSELWFPGALAVAVLALTYLFCLRPMRRGHGPACGPRAAAPNRTEGLDGALAQAHAELTRLRGDRESTVATGGARPGVATRKENSR